MLGRCRVLYEMSPKAPIGQSAGRAATGPYGKKNLVSHLQWVEGSGVEQFGFQG